MEVWVVTQTEWSCDIDGGEERSFEIIDVCDSEEKAKEECEIRRLKAKQYWGNWEYDYVRLKVK